MPQLSDKYFDFRAMGKDGKRPSLADNNFGNPPILSDCFHGTFDRDSSKEAVSYKENDPSRAILPSIAELQKFVPDQNAPIRQICVNFHYFWNDQGKNLGDIDDVCAARQHAAYISDYCNFVLGGGGLPSDVVHCGQVKDIIQGIDSRIRIGVKSVNTYNNTPMNGSLSFTPLSQFIHEKNNNFSDALNIFVTGINPPYSGHATIPPFPEFVSGDHFIWLNGNHGWWAIGQTLIHEIGHVLGLRHTYEGGGFGAITDPNDIEFMADIHGCPDGTMIVPMPYVKGADPYAATDDGLTNNLMAGTSDNRWVSTMQIALMHSNLQSVPSLQKLACSCHDMCVSFCGYIDKHNSSGPDLVLEFDETRANHGQAWDGRQFTAPGPGNYEFHISFVKEALTAGGTDDDVAVFVVVNGISGQTRRVATCLSGEGQRRDSASTSVIVALDGRDMVHCEVWSDGKRPRSLWYTTFTGKKICC